MGKGRKRRDLEYMLLVGPVKCYIWPQTFAQNELNGQIRCHGRVAIHRMHAILSFFGEQPITVTAKRHI